MDEINLAQYSSAFQRFLAISAFHQMCESAKSPNSLWLLIKTAFFTSLTVDPGWQFALFLHSLIGRQSRQSSIRVVPPSGYDSEAAQTAILRYPRRSRY